MMCLSGMVFSLLASYGASAGPVIPPQQVIERIGPGVTPPRIIHKVEPEYTAEARGARVQGTVVVEVVINQEGRPTEITVVSPAGYGLDESAEAAIQQWVFLPGRKNGRPVPVLATVEVNFRLLEKWVDAKAERRRTEFNGALARLSGPRDHLTKKAVKTMEGLAKKGFAPAIYQMSLLYRLGKLVPLDVQRGEAMLADAARCKYAPAMYDEGLRLLGETASPDIEKGLDLMRGAAGRGSVAAQFNLGKRYETGDGVSADANKAIRYFRLCAAKGEQACQYHVAALLRAKSAGDDRRLIEAVAWADLAAAQGNAAAAKLRDGERQRLRTAQRAAVEELKKVLVRK